MKRVVYFLLLVGALYAAVLSPYGVLKTKDRMSTLDTALRSYVTAKSQLEGARMSLQEAEAQFINDRSFEIAYSDITRLMQVLDNVSSVTVSAVNVADPEQNFMIGSTWTPGQDAKALVFSLAVDDTVAALRMVGKMQLPIYSVTVTEPNIVNVTFLTGGDI